MVRYPAYDDPNDAHYARRDIAEPDACGSPNMAQPIDFAFADTVIADDLELEEAAPVSEVLIHEEAPQPLAHPMMMPGSLSAPAPIDPGVATRVRFAWARVRDDMKDMHQLWSATASVASVEDHSMATVGRRVRALVSFFEWDRADLLRAAWIGRAVLVLLTTLGAIVVQVSSPVM